MTAMRERLPPQDGGSRFLQNPLIYVQNYRAFQLEDRNVNFVILKPHRPLLDLDSSLNNENLEIARRYNFTVDSDISFTPDVMLHRYNE